MKLLHFLLFICINCLTTTSKSKDKKVLIKSLDGGQNKSYIVEHMGGKKSLITTHHEGQNKSFTVGHSRNGKGSGNETGGDGGNGKYKYVDKKKFGLNFNSLST